MSFNEKVFSGSFDKTISVWDSDTFQLLQELKVHEDGVGWMIPTSSTQFWSGALSMDQSLRVWNILSEGELRVQVIRTPSEGTILVE